MLRCEFLEPMGITQRQLASAIGVPYQRINEIINGRRGITPSTALRLAKFFQVSPDFWLNLQLRLDLYDTLQKESEQIEGILPAPETIIPSEQTSGFHVTQTTLQTHAGIAN
jgi:addiction module HigA family antidote